MLSAARTPPSLATLVVLSWLSILTLNMFLPSLSAMAKDFGTDYGLVALAVAGYLAVTGVVMLVAGPLSDRFGRRPVILVALAIFVPATIVCSLTEDIWVFLAFRVLQGAVISGWTISLAIIRDTAPPQEAASRIGYITMAMAVAPMLGPVIGGFLDGFFGWRSVFWSLAGMGVLGFCLVWLDLGETNQNRSETLAKQIASYPTLLTSQRFWGFAICLAFATGGFYSFLAGAPLVAINILGITPAELGVYIGSITSGFFVGSFLSGRLAKHFALTTMMVTGRIVTCVGLSVGLILLFSDVVHVASFFGATLFVGLGNGLTSPSCNAGVVSIEPKLAGSASGLAGAVTLGCGALLTSMVGGVVRGEDAAHVLIAILLLLAALGLLAALFVRRLDRRQDQAAPPHSP